MIKMVTDYLDETEKTFTDKIAFVDEKRNVTFSQVKQEAEKVAMALIDRNIIKKPVAIYLGKTIECIHSLIGVGYSGNFFSILDTKMPYMRIEKIMGTLEPEIIITDQAHWDEAKKFSGKRQVLVYEKLMETQVNSSRLKTVRNRIVDTDIFFVLFTSGSTGNPKGVVITHRAVIAYVEWGRETLNIDSETIFGNQAPFYFILSGFEIYHTLRSGCTTYIIPEKLFSFPIQLLKYVKRHKINTIYWVPSVFCLVANFKALPEVHLDDLRMIMFGGEVMPMKQLNMWRREYPNVQFIHSYGQTEMTEYSTYYILDREFEDTEVLPIGMPCEHMDIFVLNEHDQLVNGAEIGELCGRGPSLSSGYYNNPKETAKAFTQNPLNPNYQEVIYRSGDLVRYNENGELIYVSRKDSQIKYKGNRIELGEIESAVSALEGVERNCCLYDGKKIGLFYVGAIKENELKQGLGEFLPQYMIPKIIKKLEQIPVNINGKIDREYIKKLFLN